MRRRFPSRESYFFIIVLIPVVIIILLVCGLTLFRPFLSAGTGSQGSLAGGLRGSSILIFQLPQQDGRIDRISVSEDQSAARILTLANRQPMYHQQDLPIELWRSLEALRQDWCAHPPTFRQHVSGERFYEVAVRCKISTNPVYQIPMDQLPRPFIELIETVSPPISLSLPSFFPAVWAML